MLGPVERADLDRLLRDPARVGALERLQAVAAAGMDRIAQLLRSALDADAAMIDVVAPDRQLLIGLAGVPEPFSRVRELPIEGGIAALVVAAREPVLIADARTDRRLPDAAVLDALGMTAYAGAPLRDASGAILGTVCVTSRAPRAWSVRDRALLEEFARFTSADLERGVHAADTEMERVQSQLAETQLLQSISAAMIREDDIEALYEMFVDAAVTIMRSDFGTMQMFVPDRGESGAFLLLASRGLNEQAQSYWKWVGSDAGSTCGQVLRTGSQVIVEDYRQCSFAMRRNDLEAFVGAGILAAQTTPLYSRKGQLLGAISTHWNRPHRPSDRDLLLFDILARQAADVLERRLAARALRESEQRFRAFVETSADLVYRMNADWTEMRTLASRGANAAGPIADHEWMRRFIHPEDQADVRARIDEALSSKSTFSCEHRVIRADGTIGWTHTRAIPLLNEAGEITEWFCSATDVTLRKDAEARQSRALRESQRVVETLQTALLPQTLPRLPRLRVDAAYLAAEEGALVGGDWYDAAALPDGRVLLCVGDVTGHGLSAAVMAGKLRQATMVAALTMPDPADVLNLLNRMLRFQHPEIYATALLAFIDREGREMTYASAGHPPAFLAAADDGAVTELPFGGLPLGVAETLHAKTNRIALPERFALAFYSDGLTEFARDIAGAERAIKHALASLVSDAGRERPAFAMLEGVLGDVRASDDVVLLLAMHHAPSKATWHFDSSDQGAAREVRSEVTRVTHAANANPETCFAAQVILGEALANAVQHAPGIVDVSIDVPGDALEIVVRDHGPGSYDGSRRLPPDVMAERGRGLLIIDALAEEFRVQPWDDGTEVRAVLALRATARGHVQPQGR